MLIVIILVALLIIIALILATGAFNAETAVQAVAAKYRVLNSAEGGVNAALNQLAENPNATATCYPGALNNMINTGCIVSNNLGNPNPQPSVPDVATGGYITVPPNSAYLYGESSVGGGRKVYIEAIADLAAPLTLPGGAINAIGSVNDLAPETIASDPQSMTPNANINANADITVSGTPSSVGGKTSAVGVDSLPGVGGVFSGANSVAFPNVVQLQQAAQNAQSLARVGSHFTGASLSSGSGGTVTGNAFIDGDLLLGAGTVTLTGGHYVYINGNVCITGTGSLANLNTGQNIVVVSGMVSVQSSGTFMTAAQQNSLLLVMGADTGQPGACGTTYSVDLESLAAAAAPIGTVFAGAGSLYVGGSSALSGALDSANNIFIGGNPSSSFTYDTTQAQTTLTTGTLTYSAYNEY